MNKVRLMQDDRINLQAAIAKDYSLEQCSRLLCKSRSTIYREIVNNCYYKPCRHTCYHCSKLCLNKPPFVHGECPDFNAFRCRRWKRFPYMCNGCENASICTNLKRYYDCVDAESSSQKKRVEPRVFKRIDANDLTAIDKDSFTALKKGANPFTISMSRVLLLQSLCSERTIRRYIYKGYLSVRAHELPRYVRYKHKYDYAKKKIVNVERMLGRTHSDYLNYVKAYPDLSTWQYDSVEGKIDDRKAILTITLPSTRFQFGYLISKGSARSVVARIRRLQELLSNEYEAIFQVNLSDNGPEFARFHELEINELGVVVTRMFFTNPYRSTDKAACERNHEFIRYVIMKGKSLDFLTQEKVNRLFSHINSYIRKSNKNKTPYQLTVERFGVTFMNAIGIKAVPSKDVCLKPSLIK